MGEQTRHPTVLFETRIAAPISDVFNTITDLPAYNVWLPRSDVYMGTISVSDSPVKVGSTYIEPSPMIARHGRVTELEAPSFKEGDGEAGQQPGEGSGRGGRTAKVVFEQPIRFVSMSWLGMEIFIRVKFTLWEETGSGGGKVGGVATASEGREDEDGGLRARRGKDALVTVVERRVDVTYPFFQGLLGWWLDGKFDKESKRTMAFMKIRLEDDED